MCRCFGPEGPQPTSKCELRAPNPRWWCKEIQGLYWFRQSVPYVQSEGSILYSLHRSACSRGLQAGWERELVPGLDVEWCGLLESLLSGSRRVCVNLRESMRMLICLLPRCHCERVYPWVPAWSPFLEIALAASFYSCKEGARSTWESYAWSLL